MYVVFLLELGLDLKMYALENDIFVDFAHFQHSVLGTDRIAFEN